MANTTRVALYSRALRWPFLGASVLPFLYGSLLGNGRFDLTACLLGLVAVASTHLSANLMNDVGDADTGADAQDLRHFGFFGGSKLIQQGKLPRSHYQTLAIAFGLLGAICVCLLAIHRDAAIISIYVAVLLLSWAYTRGPWRLSYHGFGEVTVLVLFGPAVVLGGAYLQGAAPTLARLLQALPFGLLTAAILVANEVPDCGHDAAAGKETLVVHAGAANGHAVFAAIVLTALTLVVWQTIVGRYGPAAWLALGALPLVWRARQTLRQNWQDKEALVQSSRMVVLIHSWVSVSLILGQALQT